MDQGTAPLHSLSSSRDGAHDETADLTDVQVYRALLMRWTRLTAGAIKTAVTAIVRFIRDAVSIDPSLDVDTISEKLGVVRRGEEDGRGERPSQQQEGISGFQGEIVAYFRDLQRRARNRASRLADKLRVIREQVDLQDAATHIRGITASCEDEVLRLNAEFASKLKLLNERETRTQIHYDAFREKNQLDRVAEYAPTRLFYFAFMAFLIGAATVAIGKLAEPANPDSALISATWAASFGLAAVLVPFVLATTICRSVNHCDELRQLAGWLGVTVAVGFVGALAFFVARYLELKLGDPNATVTAVIDAIVANPISIGTDPTVWLGVGIVSFSGFLAFIAGYKSDDPYPNYGAVQRSLYEARKARALIAKRLRRRVNTIVDRAGTQLKAAQQRPKARIKRYARLVDRFELTTRRLDAYDTALEEACNIVLDRYRATNISARTSPAPSSFSERVSFAEPQQSGGVEPDDDRRQLNDLNRGLTEFEDVVAQTRQQLSDLNWRELSALEGREYSEEVSAEEAAAA